MYIEYRAKDGEWAFDGDLIQNALGTRDGDIAADLNTMGYMLGFNVGNPEVANIEMYTRWKGEAEHAAIALISLGEHIDTYAYPTIKDAWAHLQTLVPTVKALSELAQMTFD